MTDTTIEYLTTEEVATVLRTNPATLRYWRHCKQGPPSFKAGRRVLYQRDELLAWVELRKQADLADPQAVDAADE